MVRQTVLAYAFETVVSLRSPMGYFSNMCSTIQSLAFAGESFQPELHVETISTMDVPRPAMLFSKALRIAFLALRTAGAVWTLWRVT